MPDMTVIVYTIGKKFLLAAEYPISSFAVPDAERLIEPSFTFKNADNALQHILCFIFGHNVPYPVVQSFTTFKRTK